MKKLAIITTHPIQYNAPLFRMLHHKERVEIKVFYTWSQTEQGVKYDPGFHKEIEWDIPLLTGYPYTFVENISTDPGSGHYKGIDNPSLIEEITGWGPDAVLIYGWNFKSHFAAMKHFHGKLPVMFRGDSTLMDEQFGIKKILRRLWLRRVFSYVDLGLYAGRANLAYFKAHGLHQHQLVYMPHTVDNERFAKTENTLHAGAALRQQLNIPGEALVFLFAGKLEEKKQPGLLAEAFVKLNAHDAYLIIAGSGALESKLLSLYGKHPNIRFTGFVNQQQMPALYASCDVFVLPSKGPGETWGLAINEAMAAGKAILASDACGATADLVINGLNGYVFAKNDGNDLFECMEHLADNRNKIEEMGKESEKIIGPYNFSKGAHAIGLATGVLTDK